MNMTELALLVVLLLVEELSSVLDVWSYGSGG